MPWIYVATTITLTVYGQLVIKWQVNRRGHLPGDARGKLDFYAHLLLNPWVISVLIAAFLAALSWMAAMSRLPLSQAYPFVGLSFVAVVLLSGLILGEAVTAGQIVGIVLVAVGLAVGAGL